MTQAQGIALATAFRNLLIREGVPVQKAFLFGSVVRGEVTGDSDIDIAIVCLPFKANRMDETVTLWRARRKVDIRIEPICLHPEDFHGEGFNFAREIERTGVEV